jgi:hypothetical protein
MFLDERLGHLRLPELDRERFLKFGKARALEGAGPVTVGIDLGYIKTILSHAAAVHGVVVSTEPIDLARIALGRLGLVGKGELNGVTSTPAAECSSFEIGRIPERRRATTSEFLCWMYQAMTRARLLRSKDISNIREGRIFPYNGRSVGTAFRRQCRELKIEDLHFHDLRHEGTSRLFEAGFSIEQVALVTGHKDWKMLRRSIDVAASHCERLSVPSPSLIPK